MSDAATAAGVALTVIVGGVIFFAALAVVESSNRETTRRRVAMMEAEQEAAERRKKEMLERQRKADARGEQLRPVLGTIGLLKSVAKADRQFTAAERGALSAHVLALFPGIITEREIERFVEELDSTDTAEAYIEHIQPHLHSQVWAVVEQMAMADGKATPSEKRRVEEIRRALTLDPAPKV